MFNRPTKLLSQRLRRLKRHLEQENPLLVEVVDRFADLDRVGYRLGLLQRDQSFATSISWWPLISVLGTFSSGKSTFINNYLGLGIQATGNQAVDEKYTVVCFSPDPDPHVLPGVALDGDPRFPFYQISEEIERVATGEGARIDSYLQLKTCAAERLRGRILIDSPGFDADEQRNSILRITDHIIDISDLVLVFFDARHPEPGAMQDTLEHLVRRSSQRSDASKLLFILDQIDTTWREDNLEEVVAAWQRAVAQEGLSTGRFYCIYNENAAVEIEDATLRARYQGKSRHDVDAIHSRMEKVGIERIYRIVGALENVANQIEFEAVPRLVRAMGRWWRSVLTLDAILFAMLIAAGLVFSVSAGYWKGMSFEPPWLSDAASRPMLVTILGLSVLIVLGAVHFSIRRWTAKRIARQLVREASVGDLSQAFLRNTRFWRSMFRPSPVGWGRGSRKRVERVRHAADQFVERLNDRFTDPSGTRTLPEGTQGEPRQSVVSEQGVLDSTGRSDSTVPGLVSEDR